ncbi:MAG: hypothetical protein KF851_08925 [Pirellulaceae bacterium]|nr:hypothetical protein [Pirellulaceae bacterium]
MEAALFIDLLIKVTVLLGGVWLLDTVWKSASAAARHRMWTWGCLFALLLPVASLVLPQYRLAILPNTSQNSSFPQIENSDTSSLDSPSAVSIPMDFVFEGKAKAPIRPNELGFSIEHEAHVFDRALSSDSSVAVTFAEKTQPTTEVRPSSKKGQSEAQSGSWSKTTWLFLFWFCGSIVSFSPLLFGQWMIRRLTHFSKPVSDAEVQLLLICLSRKLGTRKTVRLRESATGMAPMTWGIFAPVIMLPANWRAWSQGTLQAVLTHELAHVQRRDLVCQLLARVTCSMYWFHPLAWYAARRLKVEREMACDDCVVSAGENASDYATHLVMIARDSTGHIPYPAISMAQTTGLEHRIHAIFDNSRSHVPMTFKTSGFIFVVSTLLAIPLMALQAASESTPNAAASVSSDNHNISTATPVPNPVDRSSKDLESDDFNSQSKTERKDVNFRDTETPYGFDDNGHWTVQIFRGFSGSRIQVYLEIVVPGRESQEDFRMNAPLYEYRQEHTFRYPPDGRNLPTIWPFFEAFPSWSYETEISAGQKDQLMALKEQFNKDLRELVKGHLSFVDGQPQELSPVQIAEIVNKLAPLELAAEITALNCLLPNQQRILLKGHFENHGWEALSNVLGRIALGLSEDEYPHIERVATNLRKTKWELSDEARIRNQELIMKLWADIQSELSEEQFERLNDVKESFLKRLRASTPTPELLNREGVDFFFQSQKVRESDNSFTEICEMYCARRHMEALPQHRGFLSIYLFAHSFAGFGLDKLPLVENRRYLVGVKLSNEERESLDALRDEFIEEVLNDRGSFVFDQFSIALTTLGINSHILELADSTEQFLFQTRIDKKFKELSTKAYEVLSNEQREICLANRLGNELIHYDFRAFKSPIFCQQFDIDEKQRSRILELIQEAENSIEEIKQSRKTKIAQLDAAAENDILQLVSPDQRQLLNDILNSPEANQ